MNIADHESVVLKKALHDIVVRIGYNVDDNLFHLLEDSMWPFWFTFYYINYLIINGLIVRLYRINTLEA